LTSKGEQRVRELFELILVEKDPKAVQALACELGGLLMAQESLQRPSARQLLILEHVAQGLTNREIAHELGISDKVVKKYVSEIFLRVGVKNRIGLALWYEEQVHEGNLRRTLHRKRG
jgi:DNA-binding NarL/FixJ family response regulator